jgi:hypothetical protein
VIFFISCSDHGGIGHEGEAKITGQLVFQNGTPAPDARVELYPHDYDPVKNTEKIPLESTDNRGMFTFSNIKPGKYNAYAVHYKNGQKTLISGIEVTDDSMTLIDKRTLREPGAIKVYIPSDIAAINGYLYIPGTNIYSFINIDIGYIYIDSVPADTISEIDYSTKSEETIYSLRQNISVPSGDTATVYNPRWKFTREIVLNTTTSGAAISNNVMHFPVYIRLRSDNFNFANTLTDGSDIRFMKKDNTPLPYEIERWDRQTEQADLWVTIDTVYGDNDKQTFTMYWGNESAQNQSNSAGVFDTNRGYLAVWHCNDQVVDASYNRYNSSTCSATDTAGIIGFCKKFNGADSIVVPGLLGSPANGITLSAWAKLDATTPGGGSEIVSIGDATLIRMDYEVDSSGAMGSVHRSEGTYFTNTGTKQFLKKTGWHLVTFTFDKASMIHTLYLDGAMVNSKSHIDSLNYVGVGKNTLIGNHANKKPDFGFDGCIDEVRVHRDAVSADYVKLCYMNQKKEDKLVTFK